MPLCDEVFKGSMEINLLVNDSEVVLAHTLLHFSVKLLTILQSWISSIPHI